MNTIRASLNKTLRRYGRKKRRLPKLGAVKIRSAVLGEIGEGSLSGAVTPTP